MHEGLRGLVEVPLGLAAEAERSSRTPSSCGVCLVPDASKTARALVKVQMPEPVDVGDARTSVSRAA